MRPQLSLFAILADSRLTSAKLTHPAKTVQVASGIAVRTGLADDEPHLYGHEGDQYGREDWSDEPALYGREDWSPAPAPLDDEPPRVVIGPDLTWAVQAWGWDGGGKDTLENHKVVDVDLDDQKDDIPDLVANGHIVICYFSSGSLEAWRPDCDGKDVNHCKVNSDEWSMLLAGKMDGWDEAWLDIGQLDQLKEIMMPRFQRALEYGCHGVEPDNVDCYDNKDCKASDKSKSAQMAYNIWQAQYAHSLGLAITLKNTVKLIDDLEPYYDAAVNEQCNKYNECSGYSSFVSSGKAVFGVEYALSTDSCSDLCDCAMDNGIQLKYCDGSEKDGLCESGSWINCFDEESPLPDTQCTSGWYDNGRCSIDLKLV